MEKIIVLSAVFALMAGAVSARVTHIADWTGALPGEEQKLETSCAQQCEGYSLTTLICPDNEKLVDCPVEECNYYHKCVAE